MIISRKPGNFFLVIVTLSFIGAATLSPFNFALPNYLSWQLILKDFRFGSDLKDYWQNILLFIPFGFSIATIISFRNKQLWLIVLISLFFSATLSASIELVQFFLPTRVSNLADIIYNSMGGTIGGYLYYWKSNIFDFFIAIITGKSKQLSYHSILLAISIYCSGVSLLICILLFSVNLNNWSDDYYLAIGNEVNGSLPWNGYINSFYLSDRGYNSFEVNDELERNNSSLLNSSDLITAFKFDSYQQTYRDDKQKLPDLNWYRKRNKILQPIVFEKNIKNNESIHVNSQQWLKTEYPATHISNSLKDSDEFTLSLTIATNSIKLGGPARIISLSKGKNKPNIVIGQRQTDLYFRLRNPITGMNAVNPKFIIPHVFKDKNFHQIIITLLNNELNFYIDRSENKYFFIFNPYTSLSILNPWNHHGWILDFNNFSYRKSQLVFYLLALTPLIALFSILVLRSNRLSRNESKH